MKQILSKIKIEKAKSEDWNEILEVMEETGRTVFFTGEESHEQFYAVREENRKIISAFAIESEDDVAILKFVGVRKTLQKKGIGKYIANKTPEVVKEFGVKRFYASTWEAPEFWNKTVFKRVEIKDIKDKFFLKYLSELEKRFPYEYNNLLKNYLVIIN